MLRNVRLYNQYTCLPNDGDEQWRDPDDAGQHALRHPGVRAAGFSTGDLRPPPPPAPAAPSVALSAASFSDRSVHQVDPTDIHAALQMLAQSMSHLDPQLTQLNLLREALDLDRANRQASGEAFRCSLPPSRCLTHDSTSSPKRFSLVHVFVWD